MAAKRVEGVIFDLDNTLIHTSRLESYREGGDRVALKENINKSSLFNPVKLILEEIKKRNIPCAIVTNSPRWYTDILLKHHDIDIFDTVICYDDVGPDGVKPSSKGILMAIGRLNISNSKAVLYIGDQDTDIIASYAAGVRPIAPSWATRNPIEQVPSAIINSETLINNLEDFEEISLIADRTALNRTFDFSKKQLNFLPLNDEGHVVPLKKEDVKLIAFGRYFSQMSSLTARLHENHQLSKDIFGKELSDSYLIPQYYIDLVARVVEVLPEYVFDNKGSFFDIITVIPAKKNKNGRLENLLKRVSLKAKSNSEFIPDIFEFSKDASSLKTLGGKNARLEELNNNFHIRSKYEGSLQGKTILVIDDVITTSATYSTAFRLLESQGAALTFGICLAKTVSISENFKHCPNCNRLMKIRTNKKNGIHFYGCTGFYETMNKCTYTEEIAVKPCPRCGKSLVKRYSSNNGSYFLSCQSFGTKDQCGYTESVDEI